jgi:hypothetical protein
MDMEIIIMIIELGKVTEETKGGSPHPTENGFPQT